MRDPVAFRGTDWSLMNVYLKEQNVQEGLEIHEQGGIVMIVINIERTLDDSITIFFLLNNSWVEKTKPFK